MRAPTLPKDRGIEVEVGVASPNGALVEHEDPHLVRDIQIRTWIGLRGKTDGVGVGVFESPEPGPCIATRHLRDSHEMPCIAKELNRLSVECELRTRNAELPPAEAHIFPVDHLAVLANLDDRTVKLG